MKPILHFHLPRTGGTALRHFLIDQVGEARVSKPITGMKLRDALQQWDHVSVISGHFAAFQGDRLPSDRYCITVLRNPLDRFLSEHFFKKHNNASRVIDASLQISGFDDSLEHYRHGNGAEPLVQLEMLSPLALGSITNPTIDALLQAACRALDTFDAVGVQEELDDFSLMLCVEFGWAPKDVPHANAAAQRIALDALTDTQRRTLRQMLEPELDLYDYALSRFRRDRRRYVAMANPDRMTAREVKPSPSHATSSQDANEARPLEFGDRRCEILGVETEGAMLGPQSAMTGERVEIRVRFVAHEDIDQLNIGIAIKDERGGLAYGTNSLQLGQRYAVKPGAYEATFRMLNRLGCGYYQIDAALVQGATHLEGCYHWREQAGHLEVPGAAVGHVIGRVMMDATVGLANMTPASEWRTDACVAQSGIAGTLGVLNTTLSDFRATLQPMAEIRCLRPGADALLQVSVVNRGDTLWPASGRNPVNVSYRWLTERGEIVVADGLRTALPEDLQPSLAAIVPLHIRTPLQPGNYVLQASLLQEQNAWFVDQEPSSGFTLPIEVRAGS